MEWGVLDNRKRDGRIFRCELLIWPLVDEEGAVFAYAGHQRDITERVREEQERRKLDAQLQQAQRLESMGVLAGGIAHDFNNLLTAVLGNAELALREVKPDDSVWECLKEIETAAIRGAELTRQMLAYSGGSSAVIEPVSLNELIAELGKLLEVAIPKKIRLELPATSKLPTIQADATQIRQVLMNLILNASEAIGDEPGVITVTTGASDCDRAYLRSGCCDIDLEDGVYAWVEVTDTGCGMRAETLQRVFDPFFTTKFTGRGLGMAAVLGIMRAHHGTIFVASEPGRGTTFKVLFPVAKDAVIPRDDQPPKEVPGRMEGTILVVDDEPEIRSVARRLLGAAGFEVLTAGGGRDAVDQLRRKEVNVDCVVLDLSMPDMDGEQALRAILELDPDYPVLMSSGFAETRHAERLIDQGATGFIPKPYRSEALLEAIRQALGG